MKPALSFNNITLMVKPSENSVRVLRFIRKWQFLYFLRLLANFLSNIIPTITAYFLISLAAARLSFLLLKTFYILLLFTIILFTFKFLKDLFHSLDILNFCSMTTENPLITRYIEPAADLVKTGHLTNPFARKHLQETAILLDSQPAARIFPPRPHFTNLKAAINLSAVLLTVFLYTKSPLFVKTALYPFSKGNIENYLLIEPKNKTLIRGGAVKINLTSLKEIYSSPRLEIKKKTGSWKAVPLEKDGAGFFYEVKALEENLLYKISLLNMQSPTYALLAKEPPSVKNLTLEVEFPSYLKRKRKKYSPPPLSLEIPENSFLKISAKYSVEIKEIEGRFFVKGKSERIKKFFRGKNNFYLSFLLNSDILYELSFASRENLKKIFFKGEILSIKDEKPFIEILAPIFNVRLAPGDPLQIIYEANDDQGLTKINFKKTLIYPDGRESVRRTLICDLKGKQKRKSGEIRDFISPSFEKGKIEIIMEAQDANPSRKKPSESQPVTIYVENRTMLHFKSLKAVENLEKKAMELAFLQQKATQKILYSTTPFTTYPVRQRWSDLKKAANDALSILRKDSLFNEGLLKEIEGAAAEITEIEKEILPSMLSDLKSGRKANAAAKSQMMENTARSVAETAKRALKIQNLKDLETNAFQWESRIQNIKETLEKNLTLQMKEFMSVMTEINRELREISEYLKKNQTARFMEKERIFYLPVEQAANLAQKMKRAFSRGNFQKALEYARELLEKIKATKQVLKEFAEYNMPPSGQGSEKLSRVLEKWKSLREMQEKEVLKNSDFNDNLLASIDRRKNKKLSEIKKEVKDSVLLSANKALLKLIETSSINLVQRSMNSIAVKAETEKNTPLLNETKKILTEINKLKESSLFMTEKEDIYMRAAASSQTIIITRGENLDIFIKQTLRLYPLFAFKLREKLKRAIKEMRLSLPFFKKRDMTKALLHQLKALKELGNGEKDLSKKMRQETEINSMLGKTSPSGKSSRADVGINKESVKLPEKGQYHPPQEIRKEVLKSLNERMPASSKKEILQYLKKISE